MSIDELLSGDELITLAQTENSSNIKRIYDIISAVIDILAVAFIVLPIYSKPNGDYVYSVNLLANTHTPNVNIIIHWAVFLLIIGLGIARLAFIYFNKEALYNLASKVSIAIGVVALCLFAAAREPYATILLFLFLAVKGYLILQQSRTK